MLHRSSCRGVAFRRTAYKRVLFRTTCRWLHLVVEMACRLWRAACTDGLGGPVSAQEHLQRLDEGEEEEAKTVHNTLAIFEVRVRMGAVEEEQGEGGRERIRREREASEGGRGFGGRER
eukprot:2790373-Pleurochrysis_carterae.AAC.2